MALKMFKKYTESLVREWAVPPGTTADTVVVNTLSGEVGYTLTGRGDTTKSQELPDGTTLTGIPAGGVGNRPNGATVAVDGTFLIDVAGVTAGDTNAATGGGTPAGTPVFRDASDGTISLTEGTDGVRIGVVDDGYIIGTTTPVKIGA